MYVVFCLSLFSVFQRFEFTLIHYQGFSSCTLFFAIPFFDNIKWCIFIIILTQKTEKSQKFQKSKNVLFCPLGTTLCSTTHQRATKSFPRCPSRWIQWSETNFGSFHRMLCGMHIEWMSSVDMLQTSWSLLWPTSVDYSIQVFFS